jgi:hypothetical protein
LIKQSKPQLCCRRKKDKKKKGKSKKDKSKKDKSKSDKPKKKRTREPSQSSDEGGDKSRRKRTREPSQSSDEEDDSSETEPGPSGSRDRRNKKRKRRDKSSSSSSSKGSSEEDDSESSSSDSSGNDSREFSKKEKRRAKRKFRSINRMWARELRPDYLQTWQDCADYSMLGIQSLRTQLEKDAEKQNLGDDVFSRDSKPKKIKHKAQTDNGTTKLHLARYHRQPLTHPKHWYDQVPQKRTEIIRNFPQEQYGMQGQVSDTTIGRLHNRTVVQNFEAFGRTSTKPGKSGKFADRQQLEEGLLNYGSAMHALWPPDYSLFPIWRVMVETKWGETVTTDDKKRSDLVVEFFNSVLSDNAGKAVNSQYPVLFDQV